MELVARKAILDALKAAAGLSAVSDWYLDIAKKGAVYPYGIISHYAGGPDNKQAVLNVDLRYSLQILDTNGLRADQLAEVMRQFLHEQTLTGDSDWFVARCRQITVVAYTELDAEMRIRRSGGIYRIDLSQ